MHIGYERKNSGSGLSVRSRRTLAPSLFRGGKKGGDHGFIQRKKMLHPFTVGREPGGAVKPVYGAVERGMGGAQIGGHQIRVVKIGKRSTGMGGAGIKHGLRKGVEFGGGERVSLSVVKRSTVDQRLDQQY
jgi:hypothetical protein